MRRTRILLLCSFIFVSVTAISQNVWSDVSPGAAAAYIAKFQKDILPANYRLVKLDVVRTAELQSAVPLENASGAGANFDIPLPDGTELTTAMSESAILSPELQQLYPSIKTYELTDRLNKNLLGRITISSEGISGLLFTGKGAAYINPMGADLPDVHMIYYIRDLKVASPISCEAKDKLADMGPTPLGVTAGDCQRRTFRLAVAATGEYTTWAGGQAGALNAVTTTVNNVTAIYERDVTVRFTLVTNNNILFTDSLTDPYTTVASPTAMGTLVQNETTLDNVVLLGSANYDMGIVFNRAWDGGLAIVGGACVNGFKGRAAAGLTFGTGAIPEPGPQGPLFDNTVAHELAHMLSATHSFVATNGACTGNPLPATAWEPGGGSTIMAYAGVCAGNAYQAATDPYFHAGSIAQIQNFLTGGGAFCVTPAAIVNTPPGVTVPAPSYNIPISTPFTLTSTGVDADGNTLTYTWEQMNPGDTVNTPPSSTSTTGPNFRSYPPSANSSRTFPPLLDIINGVSPPYEVLPSVTKTMNFRVTVRDNAAGGGCTAEANVAVSTNAAAGPFTVTSQPAPVTLTANGVNTFTVTWNVAGSNAAPVNCANVNILLSRDGGLTFPYTILANTPNDGTQTITVPNLPTHLARIKVEAVNNIFFNVNASNFTILSACAASGTVFTPASSISAPAGDPTLDLNPNPIYGSLVTPAGTITAGDPTGFLAFNDMTPGVCLGAANSYQYDAYIFTPSVQGNYTFTRTSGSNALIFNLYSEAYNNGNTYNPANPCENFIISNATFDGAVVTPAPNFTVALTPGVFYTLTMGTFDTGIPALPASYTITVTPPAGGNIYTNTPPPGGTFNYTYVIVNNATGNIVAIDPGANLSNAGTFPGGTSYTVYGLSYLNSLSLAGYIGGPFSTLYNDLLNMPGTTCGNVSANTMLVNVLTATPVTFLGLKATRSGDNVLLNWQTASEQNNNHFEVERSADGQHFDQMLGTVAAAGNSNTIVDYDFTDQQPLARWNYYRIRQVDMDGRSSLSNIAAVEMEQNSVVRLFPNPASSNITLEYNSESAGKIHITIIDSKGASVHERVMSVSPGVNRMQLDIGHLSAGIYLVKSIVAGRTVVERFVKH